jgi:CubicO group peptidase (beta-lactamase class C family)
MPRLIALSFALVLSSLIASSVHAADCDAGKIKIGSDCVTVAEAADGIRGIIGEAIDSDHLKAVIVSVRIGDTPVLTQSWGESMTGIPATTAMHFRNGSVAIAYLATVLLELQEKGQLGLDDKLSKWFPQYPRADRVTLRMLINSTSGYADYVDLKVLPLYANPFRQWTPDELIKLALDQPMKCDPGTCFAYSHANFVILGEVLTKVTGKPVDALIRDGILTPLGLENTRSEGTPVIQEPVLHAFDGERGVYEDSTYWNPSWTLARGAVMTTDIGDLLASAIAIGSGSLLSPESRRLQTAMPDPPLPGFSPDFHFGLGVVVIKSWIAQTPSFAGYAAAMAYLPPRKIGIAVTATMGPSTPDSPRPTDVLFAKLAGYLAPDYAEASAIGLVPTDRDATFPRGLRRRRRRLPWSRAQAALCGSRGHYWCW